MTYARRARAVLSALALLACALGSLPLATPAASAKAPLATKKSAPAKKTAAVKKAAPKRVTGYHPHPGLAPADEYFGRLGMSILGVRSKVKDLGLEADLHPDHARAILNNALWVEDAMRDWAKKYPFDRWLPRYAYALEVMYEKMPGPDAHKRAVKQVAYLTAYFPQTLYGRVGRAKLAEGVPTHDPSATPEIETELQRLALLDGKVIPTIPPAATPTPLATPAPPADATAPATPSESPSAAPAVQNTPAPAASARPQR
jgi:hypothetical protein